MNGPTNHNQHDGALPSALTFFMTTLERRLVLRALKKIDTDRNQALLRALKLDQLSKTGGAS